MSKGIKVKHIRGSGGGGGGCFAAGTLVLMADGTELPIEEVRVGDSVMAWQLPNGDLQPREVIETYKHHVLTDTQDKWMVIHHEGGEIHTTDNHHFLNEDGEWTQACDLMDHVMLSDGNKSLITSIVHEDELDTTSWIDIENTHFFTEGMLEHPFDSLFDTLWSYNLNVDDLHTYVANGVRVSNSGGDITGEGGGGGGSKPPPQQSQRTPQEAPNTLRSKQIVRFIDLIGEGELEGLAFPPGHPNAGQTISSSSQYGQGVFVDNTPLQDGNGNFNFAGVNLNLRTGLPFPTQTIIPGFSATENTVGVGVAVEAATPVIREGIDDETDAARVILTWGQLTELDTTTGDLNGSSVVIAIDTRKNATGGWTEVRRNTISGKTTSAYQRNFRVERPSSVTAGDTWGLRVRRITADPTTANINNEFQWTAYVEIVDNKFSYPDTSIIGMELDSALLGSRIPIRSYEIKGMKIRIPSNYNPTTRNYTGIWDGTFTIAFSNNPAWVLYDLLVNDRYGLGNVITSSQIDKFKFFEIAQYCDGVDASGNFVGVDDGFGGTEPRFTFNGIIATREDALQVINAVSTAFRGMSYWSSGFITASQDSPSDPIRLIGPANVIDGLFNYSTTSLNARHTRAKVSWNDPEDDYRLRIEFVEDLEAIDRFGLREIEVAAYGTTSRGQAHRYGRWIIDSERFEGLTVQFACSFDQADLFPGSVIQITDPNFSGFDYVGRVLPGSTVTNVKLDRSITLPTPGPYFLSFMRVEPFTDTDSGWATINASSRFQNTSTLLDFTTILYVGEEVEVSGFNDMRPLAGSIEAVNATSRFVFSADDPSTFYSIGDTIEVFGLGDNDGQHVITDIGTTFIEVSSTLFDFGPISGDPLVGVRQADTNGFFTVSAIGTDFFDVTATLPDATSTSDVTVSGERGVIETEQQISGTFPQTADNFDVVTDFTVAAEANAIWMIRGEAAGQIPTKWRVVANEEEDKNLFKITAVKHDPAKFARVEDGIVVEPDVFTRFNERAISPVCVRVTDEVQAVNLTSRFVFSTENPVTVGFSIGDGIDVEGFTTDDNNGIFTVTDVGSNFIEVAEVLVDEGPVSGISVHERLVITIETFTDGFGVIPRLRVSFDEPQEGVVKSYRMTYSYNGGPERVVDTTGTPELYISNVQPGIYVVTVYAVNIAGFESLPCETTATFDKADLFNTDTVTGLTVDGVVVTADPWEFFGISPVFTWNRISELGVYFGDIVIELDAADTSVNGSLEQFNRTDAGGSWINDGFEPGTLVEVTGYDNDENNSIFTVLSRTNNALVVDGDLISEAPAGNVTFHILEGVDSGQFDDYFRDFKITIEDSLNNLVLTTFTKEPRFEFPFSLNTRLGVQDLGGVLREFEFKVAARDKLNRESSVISSTFQNLPPAAPTNIAIESVGPRSYTLTFDPCDAEDCYGVVFVTHSKTSGFTPTDQKEVKSVGQVQFTSVTSGATLDVFVDGIEITDELFFSTTSNVAAALELMRSIQRQLSVPNYTADINPADATIVDIFATSEFGATPNGRVVTTATTGTITVVESNFSGGVDGVFVKEGSEAEDGGRVVVDEQIEPNETYFVRLAFPDSFFSRAVEDFSDLNFSAEIEIRASDPLADIATAIPAQVVGLSVTSPVGSIAPDGTFQRDIELDWTALVPEPAFYDIEQVVGGRTSIIPVAGNQSEFTIKNATLSAFYDFRVRGRNFDGVTGPYSTSAGVTPTTDVVAPGNVTAVTVSAYFNMNRIDFTAPQSPDVTRVEVWSSQFNDRSFSSHVGSVLIGTQASDLTNQSPTFIHGDLGTGTTYFYWLRSIDRSGNIGAWSTTATAGHNDGPNPQIVTVDVADLNITETKVATDAISTPKIQANAVTANEIAANTITANEIAANTITANEIAANTITANEIAALTITADELAAASIIAGKLAVDSIVASNITVDSIITAKINDLAVSTPKIADNAVNGLSFSFTGAGIAIADAPTWTTIASASLTAVNGDTGLISASHGLAIALTLNLSNTATINTRVRLRNTSTPADELTFIADTLVIEIAGDVSHIYGGTTLSTVLAASLTAGDNYTIFLEAQKAMLGTGGSTWTTADATVRYVSLQEVKK